MDRRSDNATSVDVEIDPHCRRLGRSQTDFALQAIVECRAAKAIRVAVLLRWHADGGEVRRGLAVFGLWRICFPPVLVRTGRRLPVQALGERGVLVSLTGYPRGGAPGPG